MDEVSRRLPAIYTTEQVAALFKIDPRTVRDNARRNIWPHMVMGPRSIRFTTDQIQEIIKIATPSRPYAKPERRIGTLANRRRAGGQ